MNRRAFSLIELLVAICIVAILSTLALTAVSRIKKSAALTREVNAARELIAAYIKFAGENDGDLLVGYSAKESAVDERGEEVPNPACGRYPWRLAPYLDYRVFGTLLVNEQEKLARESDRDGFVYRASAHPSFGINATYVGGNERTGLMPTPKTIQWYGTFIASNIAQVSQPSKLMIFASSRFTGDRVSGDPLQGEEQSGYHLISPPRTTKVEWKGPYNANDAAKRFGFVHPRYDGRAVCAMLGGNVQMLAASELEDMRYWSTQAAEADNPNFTLEPIITHNR